MGEESQADSCGTTIASSETETFGEVIPTAYVTIKSTAPWLQPVSHNYHLCADAVHLHVTST